MFIIDAHLDLAMNALEWNRPLQYPLEQLRKTEEHLSDKPDRGKGLVCLPELRRGNIGLVVATQIARYTAADNPLPGWNSPEQAWAQTQGQLAWYRQMERNGEMVQITNRQQLEDHVSLWLDESVHSSAKPIGYILSLEGADSLVTVQHLEQSWRDGLRAVGPAHYGPGRYANGTDSAGRLNDAGKALLAEMDRLNMILDVTHLCDDAFWDALERYQGRVWASHHNCRALVNHNRQLTDEQISVLIERKAVIGVAMDAWMIVENWIRGKSTPQNMHCTLQRVADHIDHICQLAGNTLHVGIGTDLDGAFGKEQAPLELDSIADIRQLIPVLTQRGYQQQDIENIFYKNWLRFMLEAL